MPKAQTTSGRVYLVGAGPGDPGLITLRGVDCLRRADVVLYDYLVNPRVLEHVRTGAETVCLGRHGHDRIVPQDEINQRLVREARAGKIVVRLKAGDPAVFAHVAEEIAALAASEIAFEVVPGITAALACGSYAGIPLTQRDTASAVALVTGQEHHEKGQPALDYRALAGFPGTLVFYMGLTSAGNWTKALIDGGKPASTPAAIVRRCSWPDQVTIRTTLARVAEEITARQLRPPVLVVVGEVAALATGTDWFTDRPLFGVRVMVTRPLAQAESLHERLCELGADVLVQPAIEITEPDDWGLVDRALARLAEFDWLVFSSANGVHYLLDRLCQRHGDLRRLGTLKLAAIGPGTADALACYKLRPDIVPDEFRAEALAEALVVGAAGRRFLLARASRGRELLAEQLLAAGGEVEQVVVYRSRDVLVPNPEIAAALADGKIDWVTVTSSAIARSLAVMFGDQLHKARLASISPVTSGALRDQGLEPAVEAGESTMAGIVEAIVGQKKAKGGVLPPSPKAGS
jgi:uroporphyrinogen III methyltransferase / synthase